MRGGASQRGGGANLQAQGEARRDAYKTRKSGADILELAAKNGHIYRVLHFRLSHNCPVVQ